MRLRTFKEHKMFKPAAGAAVAVLCGLALWKLPPGEAWINASYDYLFRFGSRDITNKVALILMDKAARGALHQTRPWERGLHAQLLKKLTDERCSMVVFDVFFEERASQTDADAKLAEAMRRHGRVVLMADIADPKSPRTVTAEKTDPHRLFLNAAAGCGVGRSDATWGALARRHFPAPDGESGVESLGWVAARLAGARLPKHPGEQWLRYYDEKGWDTMSYHLALSNAPGFFRGKVVFIGDEPESTDPGLAEEDKFATPYTLWTQRAVGGVKIMATTFLNLMNGDWLRRPSPWLEALTLVVIGAAIGGGLCQTRGLWACIIAAGTALAVTLGAAILSYNTNYWFPWLVVVGGQIPCALVWALAATSAVQRTKPQPAAAPETAVLPVNGEGSTVVVGLPKVPNYQLFSPPLGNGRFGTVWLAKSAIGQLQAVKVVHQSNFEECPEQYETEFKGIVRYKPVSEQHLGLLRVELVSDKQKEGYYYYVMELADALAADWKKTPDRGSYVPMDLHKCCETRQGRLLPVSECVRVGVALADALRFLHSNGLTHRDIKPSNVIFVKGQPKLADVGLVRDIRPTDEITSFGGTVGYMPPWPEAPGTPLADIYALGKLLYVISTGNSPGDFPGLPTCLVEQTGHGYILLNSVILKACEADTSKRYASAGDLHAALIDVHQAIQKTTAP